MKTLKNLGLLVALTTGCASQGIKSDLQRVEKYVKAHSVQTNGVYEIQIGTTTVNVAPNYITFKVVHKTESDILYNLGKNETVEGLVGVHGPIDSIDHTLLMQDFSRGNDSLVDEFSCPKGINPIHNRLVLLKDGKNVTFYDFSQGVHGVSDVTPSILDEAQKKVVEDIMKVIRK